MVELMITVVIVSVCLVMSLRVFSICASGIAKAYDTSAAVGILQKKLDELRLYSLENEGVKVGSDFDDVKIGRTFVAPVEKMPQVQVQPQDCPGYQRPDFNGIPGPEPAPCLVSPYGPCQHGDGPENKPEACKPVSIYVNNL